MKRTISGMIGIGSLAHNRRDFIAENVDPDRVQLNICYQNENLKDVYEGLFDEAVERYNVGKRKDRQITNYYEKIRQGKQEKLFHEVIFQIGNREDTAVGTEEGDLAVKVLNEYVKDFQKRNPTLRVFSCYLHQDEATPHLHIDFIPYVTGWKGKGMDTRVSLKQALKSLGFQGGNKHDTEMNQWINHEKEVLAEIAKQYGIEWEQKGTHEEHLDVYNFKKKERKKEVQALEQEKEYLTAENEGLILQIAESREDVQLLIEMEEETGNHDKAERIAEITDHMISLFGLWNYGNTVPYLLIAGYRKNVEKCVQLIKQLLSESQKPWNMTQSPLYYRYEDTAQGKAFSGIGKNFVRELYSEIENKKEYEFLRGNKELESIFEEHLK